MTLYDFIFKTANFKLFSIINIYVSVNMHFEQEHTQKNEEFTRKSVKNFKCASYNK